MWKPWACALMIWGAVVSPAMAEHTNQRPVLVVLEENDLLVRTDRHYTQGLRVSYLHRENSIPGWLRWMTNLPAWGYAVDADRLGVGVGQSIFTPADLTTTELIEDDRPYAGWLYGTLIWQRHGPMAERWEVQESLELEAGVVGEESQAKEAQTWVHVVRNFDLPQGWENQIETEPGVALRYQRTWRWQAWRHSGFGFEVMPHGGFSLGNVDTSLRVGGQIRLGWNIPDDFGVRTITSLITTAGGNAGTTKKWGVYVFGGAEESWVLYNTFLDGNMWHDSHSVDKEPFVTELQAGFVVASPWLELGVTHVFRSREFEGQNFEDRYGSVYIKAKF